MNSVLLLALLLAPQDPPPKATFTLNDGSAFTAELLDGPIALKTQYGTQRVPLRSLRSLKRINDVEFRVRTERVATTGEIGRKEFRLETEAGILTVPVHEVRAVSLRGGPSVLLDEYTTALWAADEDQPGGARDYVKQRPITFHDMKAERGPDGIAAFVRTAENGYAEAAADEGLEVPEGDFTIEIRFKAGTSARGYRAILSKNEPKTGRTSDYCMYVQSTGAIRFQAVSRTRGTLSFSTRSGSVPPDAWTYVAVVSEPAKPLLTIYVNGKQVYRTAKSLQPTTSGDPFFLGTTPPYRNNFASVERIQLVRLSRRARTAEEIGELNSMFASSADMASGRKGRGVVLRDGSFLRAEVAGLTGATFRTDYGTLTLPDRLIGRISLFRIREEELAPLLKESRELIDGLGSAAVAERDDAMVRLLEIGEPAVDLLKEKADDSDEEIRTRVRTLLEKLEKTGVSARPPRDVLRMGQTVVYGWLDASSVEVKTPYGTLRTDLRRLREINLGERMASDRPVLRLRSGEQVQAEPPKDARLNLDTGFGTLSIPLKDVRGLNYNEKEGHWTVRTERLTASGVLGNQQVLLRTVAGELAIPVSKIREITLPKK